MRLERYRATATEAVGQESASLCDMAGLDEGRDSGDQAFLGWAQASLVVAVPGLSLPEGATALDGF